ncbi:hypothetical protein C8Q80DRAFT_133156 [Daedaleopsis nitida]|nr:hypothetical protein C8Q80DRAFT_133156 [Daedaleopsis nitida]
MQLIFSSRRSAYPSDVFGRPRHIIFAAAMHGVPRTARQMTLQCASNSADFESSSGHRTTSTSHHSGHENEGYLRFKDEPPRQPSVAHKTNPLRGRERIHACPTTTDTAQRIGSSMSNAPLTPRRQARTGLCHLSTVVQTDLEIQPSLMHLCAHQLDSSHSLFKLTIYYRISLAFDDGSQNKVGTLHSDDPSLTRTPSRGGQVCRGVM